MILKILLCLSLSIAIFSQISPPLWPEVFTEAFYEYYPNNSSYHVTGSIHYDSTKQAQRIDRNNGRDDYFCGSILPNVSTPCTQIIKNKKKYIIHPEKRQCCMCCDEAHGCGITKKDWLKTAKYEGKQMISGKQCYKWSVMVQYVVDYYYSETYAGAPPLRYIDNRIKRRTDFLDYSYREDDIPQSVFLLPDYCLYTCPAETVCGWYRSKNLTE